MDADHEEFEHIPWASLVAETRDPWLRWLGIGVGVVLAVVLGLVAARVIRGDGGTVVVPGEGGASAAVAGPAGAEPPPATTTTATSATQPPRLYTEAELLVDGAGGGGSAGDEADAMAGVPQFETDAVAARAEWFVTDFFTVDGDATGREWVQAELPAGAVAAVDGVASGVSYVEWARAVSAEQIDLGTFDVTVLFRTLAGADRAALARQPVRAVVVGVAVDAAGATAVVDLPQPVALPPSPSVDAIVAETDDPLPDVVRRSAMAAAEPWGAGAVVGRSALVAGWWRVEILVSDGSGLSWPLVLRLPDGA